MNAQKLVVIPLKALALSVIMVVCFIAGGALSGIDKLVPPPSQPTTSENRPTTNPHFPRASTPSAPGTTSPAPGRILLTVWFVCLLQTSVLTYLILRSRWSGWKLVGSIFLAMFVAGALQAAIEAAVYLNYLTHRVLPGLGERMLVMQGFIALVFCPIAVKILGRMSAAGLDAPRLAQPAMPLADWVWKAPVIAVAWVALYYLFGYFIAWQSPAVRDFYGGTDPGSFFKQLAVVMSTVPSMFGLQALRGLLFLACVLPLIRMFKGSPWEAGLAVGLLFAVLGGAPLLIPNPLMPEAVTKVHFVEVISESIVFGWLVGWLFSPRPGFSPAAQAQPSTA